MSNLKHLTNWLLIPMIALSFILPSTANAFSDVEEGNPYYVSISYLQRHGIINGYSDDSFKPSEEANRAEALKMITIASGLFTETEIKELRESQKNDSRPFTDTPISAWYTAYLSSAKDAGIIDGYMDGSFMPEETINLVETLKILLECYDDIEYPDVNDYLFSDVALDAWYTKYIAYAASKGLINIYSSYSANPDQEMIRGYLAEIIYRKIMSEQGYDFGKATFYGAAFHGNGTASGKTFNMYEYTAAHKTLSFGTIVKVTNMANDKSVQVEITDRGPYGPGRVIDLTSTAFEDIASLSTGVINVQYKIISTP